MNRFCCSEALQAFIMAADTFFFHTTKVFHMRYFWKKEMEEIMLYR